MRQTITQSLGKRAIGIGLGVALLLGFSAMQARAYTIGDYVWCDLNANGMQDPGEPGVNGVKVEVYQCNSGNLVASTYTASSDGQDGRYEIHLVNIAGPFWVKFYAPEGVAFTTKAEGGDIAVDSNPDPSTGEGDCFDPALTDYVDLTQDAGLLCNPPGTGTPGYWKNHPEAWPVDSIIIGGITYTKAEAIARMALPVKGNMVLAMFPALVSAKLNVIIGNPSGCIAGEIAAADAWMALYGSSPVKASSPAWKDIEVVYGLLDAYNNGLLCAPHRDSMNMTPVLGAPTTVLASPTTLD